jgi:predicted nucleic-acid-binding Zn-ribbon protein
MKDGICSKCNKSDVYMEKGVPLGSEQVVLKSAFLSGRVTLPDKYVCADCGYLEYYVPLKDDLKFIKQNWKKVPNS